jgi:hypothetical protein
MSQDNYGIFGPRNPWNSKENEDFKRRAYNRMRAKAAGFDVAMLDEVICYAIEKITPALREFYGRELRKSKAGQGCGSGGHFTFDYSGKTRKICKYDQGGE